MVVGCFICPQKQSLRLIYRIICKNKLHTRRMTNLRFEHLNRKEKYCISIWPMKYLMADERVLSDAIRFTEWQWTLDCHRWTVIAYFVCECQTRRMAQLRSVLLFHISNGMKSTKNQFYFSRCKNIYFSNLKNLQKYEINSHRHPPRVHRRMLKPFRSPNRRHFYYRRWWWSPALLLYRHLV